jgi:hemolysin activation/secretion protein
MSALSGPSITVQEFRFSGNTLINAETLRPAITEFVGRPLTFNELLAACAAVAKIYRDAGWIVRAYLPHQEVANGIITIHIIESLFGAVRSEGPELRRLSREQLHRGVEQMQRAGHPLNAKALDRSLLLLSDLPGVAVTGSLQEGSEHGQSDVILQASEKPLFSGDAGADNTGSRSTGYQRYSANMLLASPFGLGDQGSANLIQTEGSNYGRLAWSVPVGYDGLRIGANTSMMRYRLIAPEFKALDSFGDSDTVGLDVSYPILRSRLANFYSTAAIDHKNFDNHSGGSTTTHYQLNSLTLGINGNQSDNSGSSAGSLAYTTGDLNLNGSPNQASDAITTRTAGGFTKLHFAASRLQTLNERVALNLALISQLASKNLDSSKKFYLGGSSGVRAYPASEAGGSQGTLFNLELRWRLTENWNLTGFFDQGNVRVNRNNNYNGAATPNDITLKGSGLSLGWLSGNGANIKATWSHRNGNNPNSTSTGKDQDGTLTKNRLWLTASLAF